MFSFFQINNALSSCLLFTPVLIYVRLTLLWVYNLCAEETLSAFVVHVNTSHRCQPFPITFHPHANLFSCDWDSRPPFPCGQRLRITLECDSRLASIKRKWVKADTPPVAYDFNDPCLSRVILKRCYDNGRPVPRVVHFVTFRRRPMQFYTFLSVLSAVRFVQVC